jgi:hypothetical protein
MIPLCEGEAIMAMLSKKSWETAHTQLPNLIKFFPDRLFDCRIAKIFQEQDPGSM